MNGHSIIVIGASAGGVEALSFLVRQLPEDIPAAIFITVHFPPESESVLPRVLNRRSALAVRAAADGERIQPGHIYVAPPDRHLIVQRGTIRLVRGPTENGNRPAVDPMFRSAALAYGARVIGVVLTGNLDDGTAGLLTIKRRGGLAVVQDPADALFPSMPTSAVQHVKVDHVVPLDAMAALLDRLARAPATAVAEGRAMDDAHREIEYSEFDLDAIEDPAEHPGEPSTFSCPDCGGVLWRIRDGEIVRYRCRVGHGWTSDGLAAEQESMLQTALWMALRALEESANLSEELAKRVQARGNARLRERFLARARAAHERAAVVRAVLLQGRDAPAPPESDRADEAPVGSEEAAAEARRISDAGASGHS